MGSTISEAKAKYQRATAVMPANYLAGMSKFFGQQVSSSAPAVQRYARGITDPDVVNKWERNLRNQFLG